MQVNQEAELVVGLLVVLAALAMLAQRGRLPYPVVFVLGGLALALVPGLPALQLAPDLVFLLFLPPLIYSAAVVMPLRDVRVYLRPISLLALGLVAATTAGLAVVAHSLVANLDWPTALLLGALLSPTDAVAVVAMGEHLHLPDSVAIILEAESLLGLTLPLLIRRLRIGTQLADDPEEVLAERRLAEVALARLDTLARELQAPAAAVERARAELLHELRDLHGSDPHHQWEDATTRRLQLELWTRSGRKPSACATGRSLATTCCTTCCAPWTSKKRVWTNPSSKPEESC